ncbi:MAG: glycosyltransferase family 1 protein [Pseudomonadota bacterium]|nr:glycosyltransferase family 1 protein [Pseudomonadota bacterium]
MERKFLQSDKLRVLINGIHARSGGGITYLKNILPLLAEDSELEFHLFIHEDQFELFNVIDERIRVHLLEFPNGFFFNLVWEQFALPILAKVMSIDVTISPANYGPLMAPAQVIMLRNSLAVAGRETRPVKRLYWAGLTIMTALSLLTCRRAIAVSNYARKALTFGISQRLQNKVSVIYHGVRESFAPPKVERSGEYLLAVSDIYVQKNLHTLIHALAEIRRTNPEVILKLAGKAIDRGYLNELEDVIRVEKLEDAIEFLGEMNSDQLLELYQSCSAFVFPSTVETFGNPLVEAMACGAPIVSSNTAAMPEILGEAAIYFDPLNAHDMAAQIKEILVNAPLRGDLSERALKRATVFSWRRTAQQTAEVIKSVAPDRYLATLQSAKGGKPVGTLS